MSDDPEQSLQVEASPGPARPVTAAQTPLLGRFLGAGAPSPAVSLRNFGRVRGTPWTPHLLRFRAEDGGGLGAADRMEEEASGSGDEGQGPWAEAAGRPPRPLPAGPPRPTSPAVRSQ